MNSPSASDGSLYEIALGSDQPSLVLPVGPATLKSVVGSFMDVLVEQKIPAVVWAKIPRGNVWQVELEKYALQKGIPRAIYQFRNYRDESADDAGMVSSAIVPDEMGSSAQQIPEPLITDRQEEALIPIQLAPESHLRREYFLLIWSTQFQALVLGHRPRSAHLARLAAPQEPATGTTETGAPTEENPEKRQQHLLALCSFDSSLILRVLNGIERAVTVNPSSAPQTADLTEQAIEWRRLIAEMPVAPPNLLTFGQLFARQFQRQEELSQRNLAYRKQAEIAESLELHNEELVSTIRLKDDFLNNVGQELRTPLTNIKTALTLLNSPNIKPPQRQRYMDLIAKECDRQSSLITSLLDLVQLEQVTDRTIQALHLVEVVPGVVSTYQPLAEEKGVKLAYTVPEDLPPISCMSNWLKQIVINLLHNGIKFTPRGGQVWVRAKQHGDYVQLEFRDTGIGIVPGEIPKIFERFYRVRQSSEETSSGAGLGLTIVQQLLIHCGGSISVKSKPGEGSTFTVLLPISKPVKEDEE
ncbi:histidine kinase [Kovacikia minuta CCNUW1]|uniref:ATP-binding protein n=1 Tax=Kovacikia minuta TaxID=2931930 RepID=UPI001CCDEA59|nr:ATP-binding protein [Kovacikia minuta]UBF25707.1 histidine kinase [Kovacikia minuta CCNUW1]